MRSYMNQYRECLLDDVIPFWLNNSKDDKNGGFYTSLDRDGSVYDTDKWIWLQGREVWMFATLYNQVEKRPEWLDMALHGAAFLEKHARDESGLFYFGVTQEGKPLVQPYNVFSDCFTCMAYGALERAAPGQGWGNKAKDIFESILKRRDNPKGKYNKQYPGTRELKSFSLPMILSNLALELEHVLEKNYVDNLVRDLAREILTDYYKPEFGCILENVKPDGSFSDTFEGRTMSPGHGIETMWFLMDAGERLGDQSIIKKAADITLQTLEKGWDREYEGILYFIDVKGKYPLQLEFDQKLWWVHLESIIACVKGYTHTKNDDFLKWFEKLHRYTWNHFKDPDYPEFYGYLNREGRVLFPFKGGKWKGCFHVPRSLMQVWKILEKM